MYRGKTIFFNDFSGGLASNIGTTTQEPNQASDLDNIVLFGAGRGFRKRYGNTAFNSAMNSGANVQGLGYLKKDSGSTFLVAVAGDKVYSSTSLDGTMNDITGSLTVTSGAQDQWTMVNFNNVIMGFGGPPTNPDAPFVYTGSGNASALSGTPPSAYGAFQVNNRVFAYRTNSYPSRIYWSIVGNHADWTGTGSGSSDVSLSDSDSLTAHAVLNNNTVLLFKQNSIHQMVVSNLVSGAFPIFPLFSNVGCVGKGAVVVVRGYAYFITPTARMRVTDGNRILNEADLPNIGMINDKWSSLSTSQLPYLVGTHYEGNDYEHIIWSVAGSGSSTNNIAFVWDVRNSCWLQNTTGYNMNAYVRTTTGVLYGGGYDGIVYKQDSSSSTVTDASNSSNAINAYWTSGWLSQSNFQDIKQLQRIILSYKTQTSGQFEVSYGYDFNPFQQTFVINQTTTSSLFGSAIFGVSLFSGLTDKLSPANKIYGRGNVFQYRIRNNTSCNTTINSVTLAGKEYGQKTIAAK